jgi:RNA polymerase sigma factor (sigma-70 family)
MARNPSWIHDRDKAGQPLDEAILKAAEEIGPSLTRYRQQEIDCESTSNVMLQSAVEAASKATRSTAIENPPGYLTSVYKRLVDKFLARQKRMVPVDDDYLEDLANSGTSASFEEVVHNRLLLEQLLGAMDSDTRQICQWRLQGYSVNEIAKELGITPNNLSVRYTRGLKKAVGQVLNSRRGPTKK